MEHIECDVLVAGSGAGGLTAAVTAAHHGLKVVVAEKEPLFGGTTAYSAGVIWIPLNGHAQREQLPDTRESALRYLEGETGIHFDRAKAEAFVDTGAEMLEFIEANSQVRYLLMGNWSDYHPDAPGASAGGRSLLPLPYDGRLLGKRFRDLRAPLPTMMLFGGMSVSRDDLPHLFNVTHSAASAWHVTKMILRYARDRLSWHRGTRITNGNALVARLARTLLDREVPILVSTPVVRLLEENGRVTGAVLQREGRAVEVHARKGVVLACGGFPRSETLRARHYRHVAAGKTHIPLAPPGNTGDGAQLAGAVGGVFQAEADQPAAWTPISLVPQADGSVQPYPHFIDRCKPGYIAVDRRGKRFANEADSYHDFVPKMIATCANDPQVEAFLVTDHRALRRYGIGVVPPAPMPIGGHLRSGYLVSAHTPEELAQKLGIDVAGFLSQLKAYNANAARGEDPEFGKGTNAYHRFGGDAAHGPNPNLAPIETEPFYAVKLVPSDLGTFVGLATDARARVLDVNERPIPGLYAAGNDAASVMGGTYPGAGITIGPAMTFGYLAGKDLAGA